MRAPIPMVEVADDADALGVRRPDRKVHTGDAVNGRAMRSELLPRAIVGALAEQMEVEIGEDLTELVRVVQSRERPDPSCTRRR